MDNESKQWQQPDSGRERIQRSYLTLGWHQKYVNRQPLISCIGFANECTVFVKLLQITSTAARKAPFFALSSCFWAKGEKNGRSRNASRVPYEGNKERGESV